MKVFLVGIYALGARALAELLQRRVDVVGVLTKPDHGEGQRDLFDTVARAGLPLMEPEAPDEPGLARRIRALRPDVVAVAGYHKRIPSRILGLAPLGAINTHLSLLPQYRGPCPWKWAIVRGESTTGVTIHVMTSKLDRGPILARKSCPLDDQETGESLFHRLARMGAESLGDTLRTLESGGATMSEQEEAGASYYGAPTDEDAQIHWERPAEEIRNLVRGLHPRPGAWTVFDGRRYRVGRVSIVDTPFSPARPGTLLDAPQGLPIVATGRGVLRIEERTAGEEQTNLHHFPQSPGSDAAKSAEAPAPGRV